MIFGADRLRRLRNLGRYREILRIMLKYGFAEALDRLQLYGRWERIFLRRWRKGAALPPGPEIRLRAALEELGPAFIKLGQLLSTRADLLPPSYVEALSRLQDRVPPFSPAKAQQILEDELQGGPGAELTRFELEPLAAASIGQVHRAILPGGEEVVIKIKRPGVERLIRGDLAILGEVASFVERNTDWGSFYQFSRIAEELKQIILRELDYRNEARNAQRLRRNFAGDPQVYLPRVYEEYTTRNLLTLEYRRGITLNRYLEQPLAEPPPRQVAAILADAFFKQIFVDGFFHGDPHPGNIAVLPGGRLFLMDFGSAGFIGESVRGKFVSMVRALQRADSAAVIDELIGFTFVPPGIDRSGLAGDIERLQEHYFELPLQNIVISEAVRDLLQIAAKHRLRFPHEFILMARALVVLEGTVARLDPQFNLAGAAAKYAPALQRSQLKLAARRLRGSLRGYRRLLEKFPEHTVALLRSAEAGELKLQLELPQVEPVMKTVQHLGNRLAFSIVLASLILALSRNLQFGRGAWLERIPLGEAVFIGAVLAGLWWIAAIIRSGRL